MDKILIWVIRLFNRTTKTSRFKYLKQCFNIFAKFLGIPLPYLPKNLYNEFTMNGQIKSISGYSDESRVHTIQYNSKIIDICCRRIENKEIGQYGGIDLWLYEALEKYPIKNKKVGIIGTTEQGYGPWYECITLVYGGIPIGIDYNPIDYNDNRIYFIPAPIKEEMLNKFDVILSISTFEHSGLGRYGDELNSVGDLEAMESMKYILKKGGIMYLAVPLGKDKIIFNGGRIYGNIRFPLLIEGWEMIDSFGYDALLLERDTGWGWNPKVKKDGKKILMHPDYPEYSPILVLKNI